MSSVYKEGTPPKISFRHLLQCAKLRFFFQLFVVSDKQKGIEKYPLGCPTFWTYYSGEANLYTLKNYVTSIFTNTFNSYAKNSYSLLLDLFIVPIDRRFVALVHVNLWKSYTEKDTSLIKRSVA